MFERTTTGKRAGKKFTMDAGHAFLSNKTLSTKIIIHTFLATWFLPPEHQSALILKMSSSPTGAPTETSDTPMNASEPSMWESLKTKFGASETESVAKQAEFEAESERYRAARQRTPSENAAAKQRALDACAAQNARLVACFQNSWFPLCSDEFESFWSCFRAERGFARMALLGRVKHVNEDQPVHPQKQDQRDQHPK
eukprot:ANDGO_07939.mRNA.1 hypothetical protein AMSG_06344